MKLGQLIEHSMINTFLKKALIKNDLETIPRPFSKK